MTGAGHSGSFASIPWCRGLLVDGLDRGPSPAVSVLDGSGNVLKTQQVYPNHPLKTGALSIYNTDRGLSARLSILDSEGATVERPFMLVDLDHGAADGTQPVSYYRFVGADGEVQGVVHVTIPLDRVGGEFNDWIPQERKARIVAVDPEGQPLVDRVVSPGETVALPSGAAVRLDSVDSYARLTVSEDYTIPLVYASMILAMVFLSVTLFARQQIVLAAVLDGEKGSTFVARVRLWRNVATSASEVRRRLEESLEAAHGGNANDA